uniref:GRAS domain-containing protein n=1 Tax=Panagrellus redivivus TaxID=6233 RepID=A0A7E5A1F8_PANRE
MFPVMTLPYGLLCRLGTLSSPVEKYHLQIAGGNFNICPPTFQTYKEELNCNLAVINGKLTLAKYSKAERKHVPVVLEDNALICYTFSLLLRISGLKHLSSDVFQHLLIKAHRMELYNCDMSHEFLQALSKLCLMPIKDIEIHDPYGGDFCVKSVVQAFPQVDKLKFYGVQLPDHWLTAMTEAQQSKLSFVYVHADPENVGKFEADELLAFLQKQNEMFTLAFHMGGLRDTDGYAKTLEKILKTYLKEEDLQQQRPEPQVRVCGYDIWRCFYLPKVEGSAAVAKKGKNKRAELPIL